MWMLPIAAILVLLLMSRSSRWSDRTGLSVRSPAGVVVEVPSTVIAIGGIAGSRVPVAPSSARREFTQDTPATPPASGHSSPGMPSILAGSAAEPRTRTRHAVAATPDSASDHSSVDTRGSLPARANTLTNVQILAMVKAGVPEDAIVAAIRSTPAGFETGATALIALKAEGVSDVVLAEMLATKPDVRHQRPSRETSIPVVDRERSIASAPASSRPVAAAVIRPPWTRVFQFERWRDTGVLSLSRGYVKYEIRDSRTRENREAFDLPCSRIEWESGKFGGSFQIRVKDGKRHSFDVSGAKLAEVQEAMSQACGQAAEQAVRPQ